MSKRKREGSTETSFKKTEADETVSYSADLYLDTVNRNRLDFDLEKVCSVTLATVNIYACLVCGRYFQGRSETSAAYHHSIEADHHVFLKFQPRWRTESQVFILPDNVAVKNDTLKDVVNNACPKFSADSLLSPSSPCSLLNGETYMPGFLCVSNCADATGAVALALAHVKPLRNFLLQSDLSDASRFRDCKLLNRYGLTVRKVWNQTAWRRTVNPVELYQTIRALSKDQFCTVSTSEYTDAAEFMQWMLSQLQLELASSNSDFKSLIADCFQPFAGGWFLPLPLEQVPLIHGNDARSVPHVQLEVLLAKEKIHLAPPQTQRGGKGSSEPSDYLIIKFQRFAKLNFATEVNPTTISFPLVKLAALSSYYNLIAMISLDDQRNLADQKKRSYCTHILEESSNTWYCIKDSAVEKVVADTLLLAKVYIQIWKRVE